MACKAPFLLACLTFTLASHMLAADSCGQNVDFWACGYDIACQWCGPGDSWNSSAADFDPKNGACIAVGKGAPAGLTCPPQKKGCAAHVEQDVCNDDSSCKWCQAYTQGWPSCSDINSTEQELQANCDKPDPAALQSSAAVDACGQNNDFWACGYDIACQWCGPGDSWNSSAADFDPENGACIAVGKGAPEGLTCPPQKKGCAAHVEQGACNDDSSCKWCQAYTQGWPSCSDINSTEQQLQANCDKPDPAALQSPGGPTRAASLRGAVRR